ncbi:MAG: diguanylate cyclase [Gammaproteobacteria bacterium]|nr:MAG: diguanylate cyclase [Gammaproteobacteria bacterium]
MFNASPEELQAALQQLEQAIYNHDAWYKELNRTLICQLPHDRRDVADDAHRQCRFGQWYYNLAPQKLHDNAAFAAMEVEHERMHRLATRLLAASETRKVIRSHDYDEFSNALDRLRLQIYTLKREIEDTLYNRDPLTGVESRVGMLTKLREQLELVKRRIQHCCIAIMDLDDFKVVNDTHGHLAGDLVLAAFARYVMEHVRTYDKVFRYGGEEFLVCLPGTDLKTGHALIERLREGLAATAVDHGGKAILTTVSFGVTLLDPDISVEESIGRADKALYAAKAAGRNCSRIWDPSM